MQIRYKDEEGIQKEKRSAQRLNLLILHLQVPLSHTDTVHFLAAPFPFHDPANGLKEQCKMS